MESLEKYIPDHPCFAEFKSEIKWARRAIKIRPSLAVILEVERRCPRYFTIDVGFLQTISKLRLEAEVYLVKKHPQCIQYFKNLSLDAQKEFIRLYGVESYANLKHQKNRELADFVVKGDFKMLIDCWPVSEDVACEAIRCNPIAITELKSPEPSKKVKAAALDAADFKDTLKHILPVLEGDRELRMKALEKDPRIIFSFKGVYPEEVIKLYQNHDLDFGEVLDISPITALKDILTINPTMFKMVPLEHPKAPELWKHYKTLPKKERPTKYRKRVVV